MRPFDCPHKFTTPALSLANILFYLVVAASHVREEYTVRSLPKSAVPFGKI